MLVNNLFIKNVAMMRNSKVSTVSWDFLSNLNHLFEIERWPWFFSSTFEPLLFFILTLISSAHHLKKHINYKINNLFENYPKNELFVNSYSSSYEKIGIDFGLAQNYK